MSRSRSLNVASPAATNVRHAPLISPILLIVDWKSDCHLSCFGGFDGVNKAIRAACDRAGLESKRADDIWDNSTILQDIFDLIYASEIVVSDFTNKNPNVMYETGIAHTLGKHVIPITQTLEHIPSNLHGHRSLLYVGANSQGLEKLEVDLLERLTTITQGRALGSPGSS